MIQVTITSHDTITFLEYTEKGILITKRDMGRYEHESQRTRNILF